ncbi:MAG: GGDEF domain-containing protein [Myxococcaceae bacterium]
MAFPPHAFAIHDGRVYSEWEQHKLAAAGVRRLALACLVGALMELALDAILFREGRPEGIALPGWLPRAALGLSAVVSLTFFGMAFARRSELQRPMLLGTLLSLAMCAGGALASAAGGGFNGPLSFGLVPVVLIWPLTMPGGAPKAAAPLIGGLVVHAALTLALTGIEVTPEGRAMSIMLVVAVGCALAAASVIDGWRVKAAEHSQLDWLSSALSRPYLEERLTALCAQRSRSLGAISLVMFDVDRFKVINDTYGRAAGDEALEMLVSGIKAEIRASDFIGRMGGDEFLLVLDECEGNSALGLLERLRQRFLSKPMAVGDDQIKISFSAGIVSAGPGDPLVVKELIKNAEKALQNSKEMARNRTAVAPPPPPSEPPPPPAPKPSAEPAAELHGDAQETQIS